MASFDIQLLITNIPLAQKIDICVDMVSEKRKKVKSILNSHFKYLLILSIKSSCLLFNDAYYKQIYDAAMSSSLAPTLANSVFIIS